jgi:hypothetical protein
VSRSRPRDVGGRSHVPRLVAALVAAALAAGLVGHVVVSRSGPGGSSRAAVALPERFPDWWPGPVSAADSPPGRAIALYGHCHEDNVCGVLLGADAVTYREVPVEWPHPQTAALSADGTAIGLVEERGVESRSVRVLDLASGRTAHTGIQLGWQDRVLAWSPDASRLAYSSGGTLQLLDVERGVTDDLDMDAGAVVFSADGKRLAVQVSDVVSLVGLDGRVERELPVSGGSLAPAGWSPDGRTLALHHNLLAVDGVTLLDTETARVSLPVPGALVTERAVEALGWRDETSLLVHRQGGALDAYDVTTGERTRAAVLPPTDDVRSLQLASNLTPYADTRPAGTFDRGPLGLAWWLALAIALVAGASVGLRVREWPDVAGVGRPQAWLEVLGMLVAGAVFIVFAGGFVIMALAFVFYTSGPDVPQLASAVICLFIAGMLGSGRRGAAVAVRRPSSEPRAPVSA